MALHLDGTMDVRVNGQIERRPYSQVRHGGRLGHYEPELKEGEHVLHSIGDPIPTIIQGRAPALDSWNGDF